MDFCLLFTLFHPEQEKKLYRYAVLANYSYRINYS